MKLLLPLLLATTLAAAPTKPPAPSDLNAPPADAERLESGLVTRQLGAGTGTRKPAAADILKMRYTVWRASDGSVVATVPQNSSVMLPLQNMLPGWREAAMLMVEGESRRAWVRSFLGGGKIKEGETFVIDTELLEIVPPPVAPPDVAAPPADAVTTRSGLAYRILREGSGDRRPKRNERVVVHYTGWTTNGQMYESYSATMIM